MSIAIVKDEISRFLRSPDPEAMVIKGQWGVGKTFAWNKFVKEAKNEIKLTDYSYVTLFGVQSLQDLKYEIFQNKIKISRIGQEPNLKDFGLNLESLFDLGKKGLGLGKNIEDKRIGALINAFYLTLNNTIICIDDLERRGAGLKIKDILGLISQLKEQKSCKVVLIFNEDALCENDEKEFKKYLEKSIDFELVFSPTSEDSVNIALPKRDTVSLLLRENCKKLNLKNIRVIKKIERLSHITASILDNFDQRVLHQAIHSLVLLGWSFYSTEGDEIDLKYIKENSRFSRIIKEEKGEESEKYERWNQLLDSYGFYNLDDFDKQTFFAIENGFFNKKEFLIQARILSENFEKNRSKNAFFDAWKLYHDTFENNQEEVVEGLTKAFKENYKNVSLLNFNGMISLFKELGVDQNIIELIDLYLSDRKEGREFFRLSNHTLTEELDLRLKSAMEKKFNSFDIDMSLKAVLSLFAGKESWNQEHIDFLCKCSEEDYFQLFKKEKGDSLKLMIKGGLFFRGLPDEESYRIISEKVEGALRKIAKESQINKMRVQKYIKISEKP